MGRDPARVFRSQPALVAAGIRARTTQRELVVAWTLPLADDRADLPLTRCEIGADPADDDPAGHLDRPRTLDVADRTVHGIQLLDGLRDSSDLARRQLRDEAVDLLLRRLLAVGTPHDAGHLWLSERAPGQLAVEAFVSPTPLVEQFVQHVLHRLGRDRDDPGASRALPTVPRPAVVGALPPLGRRVLLIGLLSVLRYVQSSPEARETTRHEVLPLLSGIDAIARRCLGADDPVGALARCRVADMTVQTLRHDRRHDLRQPVAELRSALRRVHRLAAAGVIDRGAAAEAVSSANVELNVVRWTNAQDPASGLPEPAELHEELRRSWQSFRDALEIRSVEAERSAGFHLHNYAAFLTSPAGGPVNPDRRGLQADLHEALRLFTDVVLPARETFLADTGIFRPLRHCLQVASRATTTLAWSARADGDLDAARRWSDRGLGWVRRALGDPETERLLAADPPTERAVRLALLATPALLVALEVGAPSADAADRATVHRLYRLMCAWERSLGGAAHHVRHDEVVAVAARLADLDDH